MEHCCTGVILCVVFDILFDFLNSLCSFVSLPPLPHLLSMSCSMDEAVVEEPQLDQNHSSGPGAEFHSAPDHLDQEQQQQQDRPEMEDELLDLDLEDKPLHQHKQKVSFSLCLKMQDFWSKYIIKMSAFFLVGITLV